MTIPDYYVRIIDLPPTVRGVTLPNEDGSFSIYINAIFDDAVRREALEHELEHMARGHFYKPEEPVAKQEMEAKGLVSPETAAPHSAGRTIRRYLGIEGLEKFLRSIGALREPRN